MKDQSKDGFIKFLGTAGARFVMIEQLRSSGGIWLQFKSTKILIDPGPGSLLRCHHSRPKLDPSSLDALILTHKHLDHSNDINVMIEAMTEGGFKKKGALYAPSDALDEREGVVFSYEKKHIAHIVTLKEGRYTVGDVIFEVPVKNIHSVETYGIKFFLGNEIVSLLSDTKYFDGLVEAYKDSTIIVLNVVFYQKRAEYEHLCFEDALELIKKIKPRYAIFTHFGMGMLKAKPHILEKKLQKEFTFRIQCAYDGLTVELPWEDTGRGKVERSG
jgi:ribonuclease BN (tRNA processing enzyme)